MFKKKGLIAVILFFTLAIFLTAAEAAGQKITLKGTKNTTGEATIKEAAEGQKEIAIDAKGLKKNGVYTAWLVNMKPKMDMAGLGTGDYSFKSDDKGEAHYTAAIASSELEKWQMIEIAYHPDGDPKNMKKMKVVLKGALKK